ncbi:MAG: PAS domain S-box protein, partial [Gemmatimonadota bacterium]|nr:PAS domain S-box protein [Gemmatimonadota bacterium]
RELVARVESSLTLARLRREVAEVERGLRAEAEAREERLRQSEARLQSALDLARLATYEWEPVTGALRWGADLRAMWGLPADAAVDYEVWRNGIHSDDRRFVEAQLAQATDPGGDGLYESEYRVGGERQGFMRWVATRGQVFFEDGRAVALVGVAQDITERKQAEEALRRREQQFVSLAENLPDLIARYDRELRHVYVNRAITELTGKTAEYFLDRRVTEGEGPPELLARWGEAVAGVFSGGATAELEFEFPGPDGIHRYNARLVPERGGDGAVASVISIARDVTAQRRSEERLRLAAKMEAIGRLAGGIAHDFNNQLQGVSGFANFVGRDPGLGARTRQDLEEIQKATERMAGLTRQLLAFSRQQLLTLETLDLNAAVADGRSLLHRLIGTNVEMVLELLSEPLWIRADRSQLLQVLMNLAINARDAMPNGGRLTLHTGMREVTPGEPAAGAAGTIEPGPYAVLTVTDAGVGIPAADLPHIFEPFFTTKEVGQGTGLGLATVHGIVSQSHGHIWVESAPDQGTRFTVFLPSAAGPTASPDAPKAREAGWTGRNRILVVDDEDVVRTIVCRTLEAEQYEVLEARNGREALERLAQAGGRIDLVLSDIVMPGLDAHQLSERLAAEYPTVRLVWMSGYPRDSFDRLAESQPFIQKPVPADILLETIGGFLAKGAPPAD